MYNRRHAQIVGKWVKPTSRLAHFASPLQNVPAESKFPINIDLGARHVPELGCDSNMCPGNRRLSDFVRGVENRDDTHRGSVFVRIDWVWDLSCGQRTQYLVLYRSSCH